MPTYEYECGACGAITEKFASITSAPATTKCTSCGKRAKRTIGTGGAVIFKGSGFYQTDYRSADYKKRAKEESSAGSSAGGDEKKKSSSGDGASGAKKSGGTSDD